MCLFEILCTEYACNNLNGCAGTMFIYIFHHIMGCWYELLLRKDTFHVNEFTSLALGKSYCILSRQ